MKTTLFFTMFALMFSNHLLAQDIAWQFSSERGNTQLQQVDNFRWESQGARLRLSEMALQAPLIQEALGPWPEGQSLQINGRSANTWQEMLDLLVNEMTNVPLEGAQQWFERYRQSSEDIRANAIAERPWQGTLRAQRLLSVTHASAIFDRQQVIAPEVNRLSDLFREAGQPILFLMNRDELDDLTWSPRLRTPDYVIDTSNGHFDAGLDVAEVVMTGGYLSLCFHRSLSVVMQKNQHRSSIIRIPLNGVYEDKYFFQMQKPTAAYWQWREAQTAAIRLSDGLQAIGTSDMARALRTLFESEYNHHLTIKLRHQIIKRYRSKKANARHVQVIFE